MIALRNHILPPLLSSPYHGGELMGAPERVVERISARDFRAYPVVNPCHLANIPPSQLSQEIKMLSYIRRAR